MADNGLLVTISGAALSLLFYENVRSKGDQMGLLLGETVEYVLKKFTDSDVQVKTVKMHINVETVLTFPTPDVLHDSIGRVNKERLKDFVREQSKQVIGWFRFRQNVMLVPTLKDKILHKQFASHFAGDNGTREELFVGCLLSSSTNNSKGTHKFRHVFLRHRGGIFEPIPLRINNLGDDASRHDGSDYKPCPTMRSSDKPDIFARFIYDLKLDPGRSSGVEAVTTVQKAAERYLNQIIPQVSESDREVAELERQVQELKAKIVAHNLAKKLSINGSSDSASLSNESEKESSDVENMKVTDTISQRIDSIGKICDNARYYKDCSTSMSQNLTSHKSRNTALAIEKNVNQDKMKRMTSGIDVQHSPHEDSVANVSETKKDIVENSSTRVKRGTTGTFIAITRESICKDDQNSMGRGKGINTPRGVNPGSKKHKSGHTVTSLGRDIGRSFQSSEDTTLESNSLQNSVQQLCYSQALKRNTTDNTRSTTSDTSDSH